MPTIAVVMATYNGEEWLDVQLQSIANQTRLPERLIVSDDGSTDRSIEITRQFAQVAPFEVVLLEGPRAGDYGENFWFAGKHAGTDIIAWCDQDDFWHPQKLQLCETLMERYGVQFLSHSAMVTDANLVPTNRTHLRHERTQVLEPLNGDPWRVSYGLTILVRSELIQSVPWDVRPDSIWFNRRIGHDEVVSLLAFVSARRLYAKDMLVSYRQHEQNYVGVPKVEGIIGKIRFALDIDPSQYTILASHIEDYGRFVAASFPQNTQAINYFSRLHSRCLRRSKIHQSRNRSIGMRRLFAALSKGDYRRKSSGCFGGLAFARDAVAVIFDTNSPIESRREQGPNK